MRVLFLNYEYPPLGGGAGNATKYLLQEYSHREDVSVDLITSAIDEEYIESVVGKHVHVFRLPVGKKGENLQKQSQAQILRYAWRSYVHARACMKSGERYDVIHAFFSVPSGAIALALALEFRVPYIVSLRGADVPGYAERFKWLYCFLRPLIRYIWKRADRVVSNSQGLKRLALETNKEQHIEVIYNGVDTEFFQPDISKRNPETITVLCASRLTRRKGLRYAIEAFHMVHKEFPQLRMILAGGDGDATEELKEQVKTLGLQEKIVFFGEYTHGKLLELEQMSDIFLFPSLNEGMSNSMLEAMAGGLPIIMTPTGGAEELIQNGKNGFLVQFRDPSSIAQALRKMCTDQGLRESMGEESRKLARSLSWKAVAGQYMDLYRDVYEDAQK